MPTKANKGSLNELASQGQIVPTNPDIPKVQSSSSAGSATPINPLPFMAQENANIKTIIGTDSTEPVYYSGRPRDGLLGTYDAVIGNPLKNWFRRTWAKVNDPYKILPNATPEQMDEIKRRAAEMQTEPYTTYHGYGELAGYVVSRQEGDAATQKITTIDFENMYQVRATREVAKEANGALPQALEDIKNVGGSLLWSGAMAVFGSAEWVVRQGASVVKTLDDVADQAAGADDPKSLQVVDSVLSFQNELEKKNKALYDLTQRIPIMNKNVLEFAKVLYNLTPYEIFKDAGRLVANLDNVKEGQFLKTLNANLAGSQMVYTMLGDVTKNEEYIRRYEEGESTQKLVMEIQDPTQELLGGIIGDPTTWVAAPAKLYSKEGTRILDNAVKSAAEVKVADVLTDTRTSEVIKSAVSDLAKIAEGNSPKTTQEVLDTIQNVVKSVQKEFEVWKGARGINSLTSTAKESVILEEAKDFYGKMAAIAKQLPDGIDRMTEAASAMVTLARGGDEKSMAEAVAALGNSPFKDFILSPRSMRVSHMMASVSEELPNIQKAIDEGDVSKVANIYANQIKKYADNTIHSVNELAEAPLEVEKILRKIGGDEVVMAARNALKQYDGATENLNKLKELLTQTKQSARGLIDEFKGLVKKKSSDVSYLQEVRSDILKNADSQIRELETQFKALKSTPKNNEILKSIAEIKGTIADIRKIKKMAVVEDIEKSKGLYASAQETLKALVKRLDGDINKVVGMVEYAQVERTKALGNLKEFNVDGTPIKQVLENLDKYTKLAQEYKDLPANVKFINGLNELAKRPYMAFMKPLSEIYFGMNRFAYPARNVMSAIPGMGFELGFADAVEVAGKAIPGSQIEKLGVSMLEKNVAEIEKLVGMVPGAATRGDTAIGDFVDTSRKWLGVIRGGGEVAQLSEQIMGTEIVLRTIKRELRNALKYGAIPETTELIAASLSPKDAKVLQEFAFENGGDVSKTIDQFRKFMGGEVETFRHTSMSERLHDFLDHYGGENSPYAELDNALKESNSVEEWRAAAEAAWKKMEGIGEWSRTDGVNFSDDIPETFVNDVKDAQRLKALPPDKVDGFQRVIQATRNAKDKFKEVETSMLRFFYGQAGTVGVDVSGFDATINTIRKQSDALEKADAVRNLVVKIRESKDMTSQQMWDMLNSLMDPKDIKSFGISKFTEVDPSKITPYEMKRLMWESYFSWRAQHYADKMNDYVSEMTAVFEGMSQVLGTTVADAAKMSGSPIQQAADTVSDTYKFLMQQQVDVMSFTRRGAPEGTTFADLSIDAIKQAGYNSQSHLFNTVNKYRREMGQTPWTTFEQVPMWEVQDAVRRAKRDLGFIPVDPKQDMLTGTYELMLHPPLANDKAVTPSRMIYDSLDNAKSDFDKYVDGIASRWGETTAPDGALSDDIEKALGGWAKTFQERMFRAQTEAVDIASATRDALLYDYRKTLGNVAAQYVSPFHYYHLSASRQWLANTAADPKWGAIYVDYKEYMANKHAGLPDYWKQNVAVSGLPGIDPKNPLFFNIEASVNPIYQMVGVDYNNPEKRVDWLSSTVDSLSKIVPGLYQPLQWLVAAELYSKGERDAGNLWLGRLIPGTKVIKSLSNAIGVDIPLTKYNEVDPFVSIMMDGLDPSETKRALLYLSTITEVNGVPVTEEQRIQAAYEHKGPLWDEAVRDSLSARALPEAISYFMGVGYKPRTQTDIVTEQFFTDYRKLIAARSVMTEDQFTAAWQALREKSAQSGVSMDVLLIGRKAGEDRDTAFDYNVLSRIPPGQLSDIADYVGIKPYMIEDFYASKGDMSKWTESDRMRFNAAMLDLSAMLTMPDNATRQEWTQAKSEYKDMQNGMKDLFGENILEQINTYFDLSDGEKEDYIKIFPQVEFALQMQTAYVATNPLLGPYYNSLNTVNRYETNKMYDQLELEFGNDITDKADMYYYLKDQGLEEDAKALYQQEGLKAYFKRKIQLQQEVNIRVANSASMLPDNAEFGIRPEFQPQSGIQTDALNYATGPSQESQIAAEVWVQLSPPYQSLIRDYYNGEDLPYSVEKRLDYLARDYGMSKEEMLRILGAEVVR